MKYFTYLVSSLFFIAFLSIPALASFEKPGEHTVVHPARCTWYTGYFQEAIVREGLKELGYDVKKPQDLQNAMFYRSVTLGDVDYWVNGWFPMHNALIHDDFFKKASLVGYIMKAGGMQGYLVSKAAADKYHITSLADFKRPEVRAAFDSDGDGKVEMTACESGWACKKNVEFQLKTYGLQDIIKPINASYSASIADSIARYKAGKPILFYTWTPNWTIYKLKPGKDVVWINVPKIVPSKTQKGFEKEMVASGIEGAVTDPIKLGFVACDIRTVANNKFLAKNPAAKKFFQVFTISLADVSAQNQKMEQGEKTPADIERQAKEWISAHQEQWDKWLQEARIAARDAQ